MAEEIDPERLPGAEDVNAAIERAEKEEAEREQWLATPAAGQQRLASRTAFASLPPAEAEALLGDTFAEVFRTLNADPARYLSDAQLLSSGEDETTGTVKEDGDGAVLDAAIPLRTENENGELRKVDLSLEATAEGFETTNALVDVEIPESAPEPIEVGEEDVVEISQPKAAPEREARRFGDENVFYPDVLPDTDMLVAPTAGGVEIFNQLRSEASPETFRFEVEAPAGGTLQADGDWGARVISGGETIAVIPEPSAIDAQGTDVPVEMEIEGESLVLHVEHRDADYAMPILLDPILEEGAGWYAWANLDATSHWSLTKNVAGMYGERTCIYECFPWSGHGLYVSGQSGTYWPGQFAHWSYSAPNVNSYVQNPTLGPYVRHDHGCNAATTSYKQPHDYFGLWGHNNQWVYQSVNSANQPGMSYYLPYGGLAVVFGLGTGAAQFSIPCWRDLYAGGASIFLDDWHNPGFSAPSGVPSHWIDGKTQFTISTTASDAGLGVNRVKLLSEGQAVVGDVHPYQCTGTRRSPCPNNYNAAFTQTGGSFGQGVRSAKIYVSDPSGKSAESGSIPVKVDLTPPDVTLEGKLATATDADEGEAKGDADVETLRLPVYNLTIKATDEGSETNSEYRKRSGVEDIEIWLQEEGKPKKEMPVTWDPTPSCVASCSKEGTYKLELSKLDAAGTHRLEVKTVDFADNVKVRDIEFEYYPATGMKDEYLMHHFSLPDGQGNEDEDQQQRRPELAVNVINGNLVYRQKDLDVESTAALDLEVERYYNSMLPASEDTEWGKGWTLAETPDLKPVGGSALAAVATMTQDPSLAERYFSLWLDMPTPAGARTGYELNFKLVSANTYDVTLLKWQAGEKTELASKAGVSFSAGNSLALVDEGATVSAWTNTGSGFDRRLSAVDPAFEQGKAGVFGAGNIVRISKFKAGELDLTPGMPAALAALPVIEVFDGSSTSNSRFAAEWSALGWAGGGTPKGATTSAGWRPVDAFTTAPNGAFYNKNLVNSGGAAEEAELLDSSGALESDVLLPSAEGQAKFDPKLQATLEKRTGGGFHLIDESGESGTAVAFDETGQTEALLAGGDVKVDYSYEGGALAEIAVEDPGTLVTDEPAEIESTEPEPTDGTPLFHSSFGSAGSGDAEFGKPADVAIGPDGDLWVADYENHRIQHFNPAGEYLGQFGTQGGGDGKLNHPASIAIDAAGDLWVADAGNHRIQKFNDKGEYLNQFGSYGTGNSQFNSAEAVAIASDGTIWVGDTNNGRLQQFTPSGEFIKVVGSKGPVEGPGNGEIYRPAGIDIGPGGEVWVADWTNQRVVVFSQHGAFLRQFGSGGYGKGQFARPGAIEADEQGNIWVGDQNNGRIQRFDSEGNYVDQFGSKGSGQGQFSFGWPFGFAVGEDRRLWVADRNNNRVQRWEPPYEVSEDPLPEDDDPSVEVETEADLVTSVIGEEAGEISYEHSSNGLLTSVDGPDGETTYKYDDGRMTEVTLPNGTYGTISYFPDGRVETVTVAPEGADPKTTRFAYTDVGQRKTAVEVPGAPNITYEIGDDVSLLKWWNTAQPPELILWGNLYDQKEKEGALWPGDYQLTAKAEDVEGLASIEVLAGNSLVEEFSCQQVGGPPPECTKPDPLPWVMETESYAPGRLQIEVIATDSDGESTSERFWVDVPEPPPPPAPGTPIAPRFSEIKTFREDYGLEIVFPVANPTERNERIFNLINAWHEPNTPLGQVARTSQERWGVPLRPEDVAEMEYREWFLATNGGVLDGWFESAQPAVYAGYYIDHRAGGVFRIGFTVDQEGATEALKNALPLVAKERVATFPAEPAYDWKTLNGAEDTLIESLPTNSALDSAMSDIGLSAQENRVELFTQGVPAAEAAVSSVLGGGHPVIFRYTPNLIEPMSGRMRAQGPMLAGDRIFNLLSEGCTAGFGTYKLGKEKPNGNRPEIDYMLTAGHCSNEPEGSHYFRSVGSKQSFGDVRIDPWTNGPNFGIDAEAILLKNPDVVPRAIYVDGSRRWGVQPAKQAFVGDLVYFSGATTGSPNPHGEVVGRAKGAVKRPNGRRSGGYWVHFKPPIDDGDSGAPVYKSDGSAIGLAVGAWTDSEGRHLTLVEPLLHPPNMRQGLIPGILHSDAMKPMYMRKGPGP